MEVYILDSLLRRTEVVDKFESLIWTERFSEIGDFELDLKSTMQDRVRFQTGTKLAINNSYRVMTVETVEDATADDGKEILKVKGRSLEAVLEDRVIKEAMSAINDAGMTITNTPGTVARAMFDYIVRTGSLDIKDKIPFLQPGTIFPAGTIPEPQTPITWNGQPEVLYTALKDLCDAYDLGFRLVRNFDTSQLYFDIYSGNDRTTRQTNLSPVIFSVGLDNIQNTTELSTLAKSKNVAYVFSAAGYVVVYGENVPPDVSGFDRRVLVVDAGDIAVDDPNANTLMIQRGTEELNKARASQLFDGEVNEYNEYKYGTHYELGDLVEMRNRDGIITYKRVTEQIFASDAQGDRSYPTLTADLFAGVDTWAAWNNDPTTWADYESFGYVLPGWLGSNADLVSLPAGVTFNKMSAISTPWQGGTNVTDPRALLGPDGVTRNAATLVQYHVVNGVAVWDDIHTQLHFTNAFDGILRVYLVDWDSTTRTDTVTITDSQGSQSKSTPVNFHDGVWLEFPVHVVAGSNIDMIIHANAGINAVVSGFFLYEGSEGDTWATM